jgi:hypothetical protein
MFLQLLKFLGVFFSYGIIVLLYILLVNMQSMLNSVVEYLASYMKMFDTAKEK